MSTLRYCTLFRVGYWGALDAECRTEQPAEMPELRVNYVHFVLINQHGHRLHMGYSIITGYADDDPVEVFDENGDTFADLNHAMRAHASKYLELKAMPGLWTDKPVRYETWIGGFATAFDRKTGGE